MRSHIIAAAAITALSQTAAAAVEAKNVIYVIPDGWGPASQTLSRDLQWLVETGTNSSNPEIGTLAADNMVRTITNTFPAHVINWRCKMTANCILGLRPGSHPLSEPPHHGFSSRRHRTRHWPQDEQWLDQHHS
jgi:hypothetical protein